MFLRRLRDDDVITNENETNERKQWLCTLRYCVLRFCTSLCRSHIEFDSSLRLCAGRPHCSYQCYSRKVGIYVNSMPSDLDFRIIVTRNCTDFKVTLRKPSSLSLIKFPIWSCFMFSFFFRLLLQIIILLI